MSITLADLEAFQRFAADRLVNQGAESLNDLLREWELTQEHRDTIDSIKRGMADLEAGRTRPINELLNELRTELTSK